MRESRTAEIDGTAAMYPGGKNGDGVFQRLINLIPPHDVYIEAFLGSGAIMRRKRRARHSIGLDLDAEALKLCKYLLAKNGDTGSAAFLETDALTFLAEYEFTGDEFVYCDPPYHPETRGRQKIYNFEMTAQGHERLLRLLKGLPCKVLISGYDHPLYADMLSGWTLERYQAQTRGGPVEECAWFNYPLPDQLHDYSYLGENYRERERIKRMKTRWCNKLKNMDRLQRLAIMSAIQEIN